MLSRNLYAPISLFVALALGACGSDDDDAPNPSTRLVFDTSANIAEMEHFYDLPFPSDVRRKADGRTDWTGFPNPRKNAAVAGFLGLAADRVGASLLPVAHFQFSDALAEVSPDTVWPTDESAPFQILNVDDSSPERGKQIPAIAATGLEDVFRPEFLLSVSPAPGHLLRPKTRYAVVVTRAARDAAGRALGVSKPFAQALRSTGTDTWGKSLEPLRATWELLARNTSEIVAATVFTTGAPVEETAAMSDSVNEKFAVTVDNVALVTDAARHSDSLCEFSATVTYPQFQRGTPPFDTEGDIVLGADGMPVKQRDEVSPVRLVIPRKPMPDNGYPLVLTIHGTGGRSDALVAPYVTEAQGPVFGRGTAFPLAELGFASAGSAMPVNKERVPNGPPDDYVNPANLAAIRHTLRQGVFESRLYVSALLKLRIPASAVAACTGASLPAGAPNAFFDANKVYVTGQSLGGMYASMVTAVDPRVKAVVPTGAGGYFALQLLYTTAVTNAQALIQTLIGTNVRLSTLHPALGLAHAGLEPADPISFVRRIGAEPLAGKEPVPVMQPGAPGDPYFPIQVYDALAVSYKHPVGGALVWPDLGVAVARNGLGVVALPLTNNVTGSAGAYTGAVVPVAAIAGKDPHQIIFASEPLRHQLSCFFYTHAQTGKATIVASDDTRPSCGLP